LIATLDTIFLADMVVVEEEEIISVAEFKSSFNHSICGVPADAYLGIVE
jgi:hypothetical protein